MPTSERQMIAPAYTFERNRTKKKWVYRSTRDIQGNLFGQFFFQSPPLNSSGDRKSVHSEKKIVSCRVAARTEPVCLLIQGGQKNTPIFWLYSENVEKQLVYFFHPRIFNPLTGESTIP